MNTRRDLSTITRAYSVVEVKSIDDDSRTIEGIASTPNTDRMGDVIDPDGAAFNLPIPLLWQHDRNEPVGEVYEAKVTRKGIAFKARLAKLAEPASLRDELDRAWARVKAKLVRGVSIGFRPTKPPEPIPGTYGLKFAAWEWLELSLVTIPANADATISVIRSFAERPAASGGPVYLKQSTRAGVSAATAPEEGTNMNLAEQISSFEAKRAAFVARMEAIMSKAAEEGRTLDQAEEEEYDGIETEVATVDKHLVRLRATEKLLVTKAAPVRKVTTQEGAANARAGVVTNDEGVPHRIVQVDKQLPPGIGFARFVMCMAQARGDGDKALRIARKRYSDHGALHLYIEKAAVDAATTTDATWASPLVETPNFAGDFIEYMRPATILGKFGTNGVPALRPVPFNVSIAGMTSGGSAYWVGEGKPKPLTRGDFERQSLGWAKVANIAVLTDELVRFSTPSAEALVRDMLRDAIAERLDIDFVDPAKAAVANVSPASVTNGVTPIVATGTDADAMRADVNSLFAAYDAADVTVDSGVWIMGRRTARAIASLRGPLGEKEFDGMSPNGGTFEGYPVIVSGYIDRLSDTSGNLLVFVNASDIWLADDGQVAIDASREASLQMDDAPTNASEPVAATAVVSMFQTNSIAIRAERYINWAKRRANAVQVLSGVNYGAAA